VKKRELVRKVLAELADDELRDPIEQQLYRWRNPGPGEVAEALGISPRHVLRLCQVLGLKLVNKGMPDSRRKTWTIPLAAFRALRSHLGRDADRPAEARSSD
jgi:hypothetical protein